MLPAISPSKASPPVSATTITSGLPDNLSSEGLQERCSVPSEISLVIDSLQKQVASDRCVHVKRKMEENRQKMIEVTNNLFRSSQERRYLKCTNSDTTVDVLTKRQNDAIDMQNGRTIGENDKNSSQDDAHDSAVILLGSSIAVKNAARPVKLTEVKRLPPYITWTFLDRNQKMREDKSVGRRRIYYDKSWGETLVASDSDEEAIDEDEEKKEFVDSEDYILRMTINKVGLSDTVLDVLAQRFSRKPCEVKARYEVLTNRENAAGGSQNGHREAISSSLLDKDLNAALHSFDNLFCRRCFVFNCGLHGCSEEHIFPAEKQLPWSCPDEGNIPCGLHCYRLISKSQSAVPSLSRGKPDQIESATSNARDASESSDSESRSILDLTSSHPSASPSMTKLVEKSGIHKRNSKRLAEHGVVAMRKRKKKLTTSYSDSPLSISWNAMEKALYRKGVEIFGRNSCLIARNLLHDTKTCSVVFEFMNCSENNLFSEAGNGLDSLTEGCSMGDGNENMGTQLRRRSRFFRRRGRVRRLKYTSKSTGYHSFRKQISEDKYGHHYNPCGCQSACGKECFCFLNKTCCEKYCGCPRSCKNQFRGCHCTKSQCRTRQCPCYAACRECDPDVCRNCWISCGDGTLGVPQQKGDNYECRNMKLLLKQQQKVLLGRSDVSGWGVFLKNSVEKNEYIGEYTGELVSQHEADKRGKIYDLVNSSYLFNLNNQYVVDAFRKGNKLKFANHSFDPNCYAKVLMVAGDHRVGIFAKQRICAGEEIFYDYGYDDDTAPDWIKKLKASGSEKDEHNPSSG